MKPRKYAITQLGEAKPIRRVYPRRDANCPIIAHVRPREQEAHIGVPCWLVNLCEEGCLITSDYFPRRVEEVYLTIPGVPHKMRGKVRAQGNFTMNIKFAKLLPTDVVEMVARIKTIPKLAST